MDQEIIQIILGMKIGQLRQDMGISLKELSARTGTSVSYLNEIEKGKKYPKVDKMLTLAKALEVTYEELISPKLDGNLNPLASVLQSPMMRKFPFHIFKTSARELVQLMTGHPREMGILARMLSELGRSYDIRMEQFFHTAMRCHQMIHNNFFPELEDKAAACRKRQRWDPEVIPNYPQLTQALEKDFGIKVDEDNLLRQKQELAGLRSVLLPKRGQLWLNDRLSRAQRSFAVGKELGYANLGITKRTFSSPALHIEEFSQVYDNFRASYFAGALLIPKQRFQRDIKSIFKQTRWNGGKAILQLLSDYGVTPETFLYRWSELIPHCFKTRQVHFMKFTRQRHETRIDLNKQLNMSRVHIPNGLGLNEHFCRRWLSLSLINQLEAQGGDEPIIDAQRSKFLGYGTEFFCITIAYPGTMRPDMIASVTLGFPVDKALKNTIRFWSDDEIPYRELGQTCERCPLEQGQCSVRQADADLFREEERLAARKRALEELVSSQAG